MPSAAPSPASAVAIGADTPRRSSVSALTVFAAGAGVSFGLGVLTAYGQGWLPDGAGSLANSVGPWAVVAFLLAFATAHRASAVAMGSVSLLALLGGSSRPELWPPPQRPRRSQRLRSSCSIAWI